MKKYVLFYLTVMSLLMVATANAAVPVEISDAFTEFATDAATVIGLVVAATVVVAGGFKMISLFKRGISKA